MIYEYFRETVRYEFTERRRPRFRRQVGSCTIVCEWNALRYDPGRIVRVSQNYRVLFNFRLCWHCMIKKRLEAKGSRTIQPGRVNKERKLTSRGKWESVFGGKDMDNVRKETHVVSVMTDWYKETCTVVRDEKNDRPLPHQIRRPRLTAREKILKNIRQQRWKLFRKEERNSVPLQKLY